VTWPILIGATGATGVLLGYGLARLLGLKRDLDRNCTTEPREPRWFCDEHGHTATPHGPDRDRCCVCYQRLRPEGGNS
jgi:hypothetical protein